MSSDLGSQCVVVRHVKVNHAIVRKQLPYCTKKVTGLQNMFENLRKEYDIMLF